MHGFPSSHTAGEETHAPATHASVVHAFASEHAFVSSLTWPHPAAGSHVSSVQGLASVQSAGISPVQVPKKQLSPSVHAFPSSQGTVFPRLTHPTAGSHASSVHTFPSSQSGAGPPAHRPPAQVSAVVQALPSSHAPVLFAWVHPVAGSQASSVHTFPSLQFGGGPPRHAPAEQASAVVQALWSSHGAVLFVWMHPAPGSQESSVQRFPSLQSGAGPPTHAPPEHMSAVVHALPSSHGAVLFVWMHPVAGSQESSVQPLPSLQSVGGPG